ncbi:NUDIX domain-containing protein [Candidatus Dojkabacteria bacterium]|nr:NUDIX domain-containing protein [Candidatus Dojkabacteria bacterium]
MSQITQKVLVTAIIIRDGKILMQKRTDDLDSHRDKWTTPSGFVEVNEHPEDTIVREVKEELNIDIKIKSVIPAIDSFPNHKDKFHMIYIAYECEIINGKTSNIDEDGDISDIKWTRLDQLDDLDTIRGTMPPIREILRDVELNS